MKRNDPPTEWARTLQSLRDAAGLSQAQLAVLVGVSPGTIYRLEQGKAPSEETFAALRKWNRNLPDWAGKAA